MKYLAKAEKELLDDCSDEKKEKIRKAVADVRTMLESTINNRKEDDKKVEVLKELVD